MAKKAKKQGEDSMSEMENRLLILEKEITLFLKDLKKSFEELSKEYEEGRQQITVSPKGVPIVLLLSEWLIKNGMILYQGKENMEHCTRIIDRFVSFSYKRDATRVLSLSGLLSEIKKAASDEEFRTVDKLWMEELIFF